MKGEQEKVTDKQLVARVQKGDKGAFDLLVIKYQYKVHAIIFRYVKDIDEVNDVMQEAFRNLQHEEYDDDYGQLLWLNGIFCLHFE